MSEFLQSLERRREGKTFVEQKSYYAQTQEHIREMQI